MGEYGATNELSPYFINSLYAIDRGITWIIKLKKMYEEGKFILLDRYTTSSLIYQTALFDNLKDKEKFVDYVIDFEYHKIGIQKPDNTIFLYAPFDLVTSIRNARKNNEGIINDIHERDLEYMKRVYDTAMFIADYLSWDKVKCNDGDKMRSVEDIHEDVYSLVRKRKI